MRASLALCLSVFACSQPAASGEQPGQATGAGAGGSAASSGVGGAAGSGAGAATGGAGASSSGAGGTPQVQPPFEGKWNSITVLGCNFWHTFDAETLSSYAAPEWVDCPDAPEGWGCEMMIPPSWEDAGLYAFAFAYSSAPELLQYGEDHGKFWHRVVLDIQAGKFREIFMDRESDSCAMHPVGVTGDRSVWEVWKRDGEDKSSALVEVSIGSAPRVVKEFPGPYVAYPDFTMVRDGVWEDMRRLWGWDGTLAQTLDLPPRITGNEVSDSSSVIWSEWASSDSWVYLWNPESGLSMLEHQTGNMVAGFPALSPDPVWAVASVADSYAKKGDLTLRHGDVSQSLGFIGWNTATARAGCGRTAWASSGEFNRWTARVTNIQDGRTELAPAAPTAQGGRWSFSTPMGVSCEYAYFIGGHDRKDRIVRLKPPLEF